MTDRVAPALVDVSVSGLFGHFTHRVEFPPDWEFVILHGVNGIGKTKVLDIIKSALVGNMRRLSLVPFATATLKFEDRSKIELERTTTRRRYSESVGQELENSRITISLSRPGRRKVEFSVNGSLTEDDLRTRDYIERYTSLLSVDEDMFFDPGSAETISVDEVMERYSDLLPPPARRRAKERETAPAELRNFWNSSNVHLIETQRLLRNDVVSTRRPRHEKNVVRTPTVMRFSDDAAARIQRALSDLGRESQELDRTFPSRLVQRSVPGVDAPSEPEVRKRYDEQLKLRRRLTKISVLDAFGADLQLPKEQLDPVVLRVMTEFLSDSEQKFQVVEPLLDRLELLTTILNSKFQYKKIEVDRGQGFVVRTTDGSRLRPNQLSSGEQHELVLLYDLLFGAKDNALVLIDEPEISLHVNWQKRFLSDLGEISSLTHHRFVVATHSPMIVGKHTDRMVRLSGDDSK